MQVLAKGAVVSPSNPAFVYYNQVNGFLTDVYALSFAVYDVSTDMNKLSPVEVQGMTPVSISDPVGTGAHIGVGRYVPTFTISSGEATGLHEIHWFAQADITSPVVTTRQYFDVVPLRGTFNGPFYCALSDLRDEGLSSSTLSDARALLKIQSAGRFIEKVTRRFFEPRYLDWRENGRGRSFVLFQNPVIAIDTIDFFDFSLSGLTEEPAPVDLMRVYNRHLQGLTTPDDRSNPKLELYAGFYDRHGHYDYGGLHFPRGQQNVHIAGVFGFTDPDGTPFGATPEDIRRVAQLLVFRDVPLLSDPDAREDLRWRPFMTSERTREQSYTRDRPGTALFAAYTGDPDIDLVLQAYRLPVMLGAV